MSKAANQASKRYEKKSRAIKASRSLNVLKKNKKGLLTEYQRSFSFYKKSSATGRRCAACNILILHDRGANVKKIPTR